MIVNDGKVVGRGWTQEGGRPHAEAVALAAAGNAARGGTLYVTLEPCAHRSERGPACADLVAASGLVRVVVAMLDPDPRTAGSGLERLRAAGKIVDLVASSTAEASLAGYLTRKQLGRPHVTLKMATSLDGGIALADGSSRWITGNAARAHAHLERALADAILVGAGTFRVDAPRLDVRLLGLEAHGPERWLLGSGSVPGWSLLDAPERIADMTDVAWLLVEGGARTAAAFLAADLVDRLLLYRAPLVIGGGLAAVSDLGPGDLASRHGRWRPVDRRQLGSDILEVYERLRSPAM